MLTREELQARLDEAEEVVAYYATRENWMFTMSLEEVRQYRDIHAEDLWSMPKNYNDGNENIKSLMYGGKKARQYVAKFMPLSRLPKK